MPKIVIDIPEDVKEKIAIMGLDRLDVWNIRLVSKAISDGILLDDIKAEIIEHAYPVCYDRNSIEKGMTLTGIMQVFDKHIGERSE